MTLWYCDRCGDQVTRTSNGTTKYQIIKKCIDPASESDITIPRHFERSIKLCPQCALEMEQFLDNEFDKIPDILNGICNKRG